MKLMKILLTILVLTVSSFASKAQVEGFVERFYVTVLDRASEQAGLEYWTNNLLSGSQAGADIARGFIFSEEFTNRATTNDEFLYVLYRAFFNREPDSGGFNGWKAQLENNYSRNSILDGFLFSQEFANLCKEYNIEPVTASLHHYTNNGDDTVRDNFTGLIWQDSGFVADENQRRTLAEGITYCNNLSLANYNDWRLPNVDELLQITDKDRYDPAIDTSAFQHIASGVYWFDDIYNSYNKGVNFYDGDEVVYSPDNINFVRCVRGTNPTANFTLSESQNIVIDNNTHKEWQNSDEVGLIYFTWSEAIEYCERLVLDDKSDWRVPKINEIYYILNRDDSSLNNYYSLFKSHESTQGYWGVETYQPNSVNSWVLYFGNGDSFITAKDTYQSVRCIRDN